MVLLSEFIELITIPPGDLVYHLVTLFAIQLVLGMALGHWNRHRDDPMAIRLLVTGLGFALGRSVLMLVAVLDRVGVLSSNVVLPPLERFLDFAVLLLAVWTFVPILEQHSRLGTGLLLSTFLVAAGVYAAFAALWLQVEPQGVAYNIYWQAAVWEFSAVSVLVLALLGGLIWRGDDWGLATCLFSLWLGGHALQFFVPVDDAHVAGWVRLANLSALPLVAGLVYRRVLGASPASGEDASVKLIDILDAVRRIGATSDTEAALKLAASTVARALGADMVAVGLPSPGPAREIRIVAVYSPNGSMLTHQEPTLLTSGHPLLATALQTGHLQRARVPHKDPNVAVLYRRLGYEQPGPLLVQPLLDGGRLLGVVLAGTPVSQHQWTRRDEQVLQAVGAALAKSMADAGRQQAPDRVEELREALSESRRMAQRVAELEAKLEQQRQRAEELDTTLRLREQESVTQGQSTAEAAIWQQEMRDLAEARTAAEAELAEWKERAERLSRSHGDLQNQLSQAQTKIEEARRQISQAVAAQPVGVEPSGILLSDDQGHIVLADQGARYLLGLSQSTLVGMPLGALFNEPSFADAVGRLLHDETEAGEVVVESLELGDQKVQAELTRLPDAARSPAALAVILCTEEGVKAQGRKVVSLIQELGTPMNSITSYTDLLLSESVGILGEMQRQFLQRIKANVERVDGVLDDLVKTTAADVGEKSLEPETVDLINVIEDAITSLSAQFSERKLTVQMDMPVELPNVHADQDSLYQVVQHLLSNACQCSEPGTDIKVSARLEEYDDQVEGLPDYLFVSVTDTGGGIAPEDQSRIFQRLYRADNPLIVGLGDNGVGLSVAKSLVEAQGGRIWVESEMGVGSTLSFILPLSSKDDGDRLPEAEAASGDAGRQE